VEDLLKEARAANKIDQDRANLFRSMLQTEAWRVYVELLELKLQSLSDELLLPAGSVDRMVGLEYVKGAMSGLVIARDLPSVTIAAMAQLRQEKFQSLDKDNEDDDTEFDD